MLFALPSGNLNKVVVNRSVSGAMVKSINDSWKSENVRWTTINRLLGHMPALTAYIHRRKQKLPYIAPDPSLGYAENFLNMMFSVPAEEYKISPAVAKAVDRIFTLHADHEQNASTSTVRLAGSTGAILTVPSSLSMPSQHLHA